MTTIRVADIKPNPFRELGNYPIIREKVDALKQSIKETTFWDNVLVRKSPTGDGYELSYGHHRLAALKELRIVEIDVPVRKLSDTDMLRIMAHENMEEWTHNASIEQETVAVAVKAFGEGKVVIPTPDSKTPQNQLRYAPSFIMERRELSASSEDAHPYTAATLAAFLGMNEWKIKTALQALALIEQGIVSEKTFTGLKSRQAQSVTTETKRVIAESKKAGDDDATAKRKGATVARELAADFRASSSVKKTAEDKKAKTQSRKTTIHNAKRRADEILGKERESAPKNLDKLATRFIEGLATAFTKRTESLRTIVAYRDQLPGDIRRRLLGCLRSIQKECGILADKLEMEGTSSYRVPERILALTDQRD